MASNGFQPGGQGIPAFPEEDAPQLGADYEEVARYAAFRGNLLRGTTEEMNTFPHPVEGLWWSNTSSGAAGLYRHTSGAWRFRFPASDGEYVTPAVGAGWDAPSLNRLTRAGNFAVLTFNAFRETNGAANATIVTIPVGWRQSAVPVWAFAWGLAGAPNAVQVVYDRAAHVIRSNIPLSAGHSIALTMSWPVYE